MAKHIHIHLPARTRDAGTAHDPSNGQFTSGSAGGDAKHHAQREMHHATELARKNPVDQYGSNYFHPDSEHHMAARNAHAAAKTHLANGNTAAAQEAANKAAEAESKIKVKPVEKAAPKGLTPGEITKAQARPHPATKNMLGASPEARLAARRAYEAAGKK